MSRSQTKLIQEIHEAIVGTPDGKTKGLRPRMEEVEARHLRMDEGAKGRRLKTAIVESGKLVASAITGFLAGHGGK